MSALTHAGEQLQKALAAREQAMAVVRQEVLAARSKGLSITAIARQAGLSRPTVYSILRGKK